MAGRLLHTTLALALASFPALGMILVAAAGPFGGRGWAALLVASVAAAGCLVAVARRRGWSVLLAPAGRPRPAGAGESGAARAWLLRALPLLALLPVVVAVLGSVRVQISHHGFFHSGYVYRVLAGDVPPENVTLAGHPSNTYWPYHALLAALVELLGVPAPLASALLNLALLAGTLAWAGVLVRELHGPPPWPGGGALLALFAVFGANLLGVLHWLVSLAAGRSGARGMVLLGDVRLGTLVAKFANYTGASLGVYFFVLGLLVVVRLLQGNARGFELFAGVLALLGAFALHAITGAFMVVAFGPALVLAWLATAPRAPGGLGAAVRRLREAAGAFLETPVPRRETAAGVAALAALGVPVLVFVASASSEFPTPPRLGLPDAYALSILAVGYPLLPFFVAGVASAARAREASVLFLALVCLGGYALASVLTISGRNEYKFIYLGSVALCLVSLGPIVSLLRAPSTRGVRRAARVAAVACLALACANVAVFGVTLLRSASFRDRTFRYEGRHVVADAPPLAPRRTGLEYGDLFAWVRAHTDPDTVVVVPLLERDKSVLYVLSERVPYAVDGLHYNRGLPDYARRTALLETLYAPTSDPDRRRAALHAIGASLPDRPMVLVVPRHLAARFDPASAGLAHLRDGRAARLYAFPEPPRGAAAGEPS